MIYHKEGHIISILVVSQMLTSALGYILLGTPYRPQFNNYIVGGAIRVVKPPDLSPNHPVHFPPHLLAHLRPGAPTPPVASSPQFTPMIDFRKPKTQTFFRAALIESQNPVYEFGYKVHDPKEQNFQTKSEVRVGDSVKGSYSVMEPNGYIRTVKYLSDEHGFRTQVSHHHKDENGGEYSYSMTRSV